MTITTPVKPRSWPPLEDAEQVCSSNKSPSLPQLSVFELYGCSSEIPFTRLVLVDLTQILFSVNSLFLGYVLKIIIGSCLTSQVTEEAITGQTRGLPKNLNLEKEMSIWDFEIRDIFLEISKALYTWMVLVIPRYDLRRPLSFHLLLTLKVCISRWWTTGKDGNYLTESWR